MSRPLLNKLAEAFAPYSFPFPIIILTRTMRRASRVNRKIILHGICSTQWIIVRRT